VNRFSIPDTYSRVLSGNRGMFDSNYVGGGDSHFYGVHIYAEKSTASHQLIIRVDIQINTT